MGTGKPVKRLNRVLALVALAGLALSGSLLAQGVTTGAVRGKVTDEAGNPVVGVVLTLVNNQTGLRNQITSREDGLFDIENVTPGGPFTLTARAIGYRPVAQSGIRVALGQVVEVDLKMGQAAVELSAVSVSAEAENPLLSTARTGSSAYVTDSFIANLPSLERNFTDFINTSPQVNGTSVAGQNNRYNNIQIDGGVNNDLFGLGSTGTPGGQVNERPISLDAVKEYQILIAPFDVRQGGFTGGLINAITKSGTNTFHGSLYFYGQNQNLARGTVNYETNEFGGTLGTNVLTQFHEYQYGATLSGPILPNRLQFFASVDLTSRQSPFSGYLQGVDSIDKAAFGVTMAQADSIGKWATANGLADPGSGGQVNDNTPDHNIFVKLNGQVSARSQIELSFNHVTASDGTLLRGYSFSGYRNGYELGNSGYSIANTTESWRLRYNASISDRYTNELLLGYQHIQDLRNPSMMAPLIFVGGNGGAVSIGAERYSQGNVLKQDNYEVTDNLTVGMGHHLVTVGTHNEFFKFYNQFFPGSYGVWAFANVDSLYAMHPYHYEIALPLRPNGPLAQFNVNQFGLYAQDVWNVTHRFAVTYGLRMDVPVLPTKPGFDSALYAVNFVHVADDGSGAFHDSTRANTADFSTAPLWSPRLGFNWDVKGDQSTLVRGGVGVFTGRPPYVWVSNAYANSGLTQALLSCGTATNYSTVPTFTTSLANQPTQCAGGAGANPATPEIVYFDHGFKFPQTLRVDLGGDRQLPWGTVGTVDLLYTYTINEFYLNDVNLKGVVSVDTAEGGRLMYGTVNPATGATTPTRISNNFQDVIRQYNASGDNSFAATFSVDKRFSDHFSFNAGYSYSHTEDRECLTSSISSSNFRYAVLQGPLDDRPLATSCFDVPSKLTATVLYDAPLGFKVSLTYQGASGTPYTYVTNTDANGDSWGGNDPIFVPVDSATDPGYLKNGSDWKKFNQMINGEACLRDARGTLLDRNTCRNPWTNFINARIAKSFPTINGQSFEVTLDIFNLPNLISSSWGVNRQTSAYEDNAVLNLVGQQTTGNHIGQGIYTLTSSVNYENAIVPTWNRYRLELSGRYTF